MNMTNESQLQAAMVMEFSQQFPERDGELFSVRNTTFSMKDGTKQKAMGMKAGVSDLINHRMGVLQGIEVKFPGKKHNREHILRQYVWGETVVMNGGEYYMVTSVDGFIDIVEGHELKEGVYTLEMIKELLDSEKSTIVFE